MSELERTAFTIAFFGYLGYYSGKALVYLVTSAAISLLKKVLK